MNVSVVIPAWNAADTIAEALESLLAQSFPYWEAIVVDDGSEDRTLVTAEQFARQDRRIRVVSQPQKGTGAARNRGIRHARFDWLLFLDADDWLLPQHLEMLTNELAANPLLDAAYCNWARVAPDGTFVPNTKPLKSGKLFAEFACHCDLAIHACIVRRSLVEAVGKFDCSLRICQDWDLWQRIARTGAVFGTVPYLLAGYRLRTGSVSMNGHDLLNEGLKVISQGHAPDARVRYPDPAYAYGKSKTYLTMAKFSLASWAAGLEIGDGRDARPLLNALKEEHEPTTSPQQVAECIFEAAPLPRCRTPGEWSELWPRLEPDIDQFLAALEEQTMAPALARRARTALERLVVEQSDGARSLSIGHTHALRVEITEPIPDVHLWGPMERLYCIIQLEGEPLGTVQLPICDGLVPAPVLTDAITADYAWPILRRFFEHTIYPELHIERNPDGLSLWRGDLCLADGLSEGPDTFWSDVHDQIGWTIFLQEIWGCRELPGERFYTPSVAQETVACHCDELDCINIEASAELADLEIRDEEIDSVFTVGGAAIGMVALPADQGIVRVSQIRAALTRASGFELCCAAVREGLIGRPLGEGTTLRTRLAQAKSEAAKLPSWLGAPAPGQLIGFPPVADRPVVIFGRRTPRVFGTSASRRASLPAAVADFLVESASDTGTPIIQMPGPNDCAERVAYAPEMIRIPPGRISYATPAARKPSTAQRSACRHPSGVDQTEATFQLPILVYHRVAPDGSPATSRYRVTPERFEEQLAFLQGAGFYSIPLEVWQDAMDTRTPLPGRALIITFDDGYLDFLTYAWGPLQRYGFTGIVFLVADAVGRTNHWDHLYGEQVPLLGWQEIRRLQADGVEFGSHSASHPHLTTLSHEKIVWEAVHSRVRLARELGTSIRAFAYPHGDVDPIVQHLIGACGYTFGLTCSPGRSCLCDNLLALPRIEVSGSDTLPKFAAKLVP